MHPEIEAYWKNLGWIAKEERDVDPLTVVSFYTSNKGIINEWVSQINATNDQYPKINGLLTIRRTKNSPLEY